MKSPLAKSILIGFVVAFMMALAGYLTIMAFGFHEKSLPGLVTFTVCAWNYLLASWLVSEKWLPVIEAVSLLCMFLYGFLFGWLSYSGLIYLGMLALGKRAKYPPETSS